MGTTRKIVIAIIALAALGVVMRAPNTVPVINAVTGGFTRALSTAQAGGTTRGNR